MWTMWTWGGRVGEQGALMCWRQSVAGGVGTWGKESAPPDHLPPNPLRSQDRPYTPPVPSIFIDAAAAANN